MPQIVQGALHAVIAPGRIFPGHAQDQFNNLLPDRRASGEFPALAIVPVCGHEFSMRVLDFGQTEIQYFANPFSVTMMLLGFRSR